MGKGVCKRVDPLLTGGALVLAQKVRRLTRPSVAQPIATPLKPVNFTPPALAPSARSLLPLLLVAALGGCAPIVERAPFAARPDSLRPGDLLGPYDGVVVDAETDRPIPGAVVAASWAYERGVGLTGPFGAREVTTETGADGRYRIPALKDLPSGASTRIRRFTLIVYHRGHVGWRSDRRFPDGEPRRDFAQRGNRVRLEKWLPGYLHHQHLVFLGGGDAIRAAAGWEVQPAGLELDGVAPGARGTAGAQPQAPAGPKPLDITPLLSEDEVRGVTGYPGAFEIGKLTDLPSTEFYDSRHFKAVGKTESFDVALRVWLMGPAGAEAQYRKLLSELPGATSRDELGDASLRARAGDVLGLVFLRRDPGVVISVTCGAAQCTEEAMLVRIARLVEGRLGELPAVPAAAGAPGATTPGAAPAAPTGGSGAPASGGGPAGTPPAAPTGGGARGAAPASGTPRGETAPRPAGQENPQ